MKYLVCKKQEGEGCDYTIGCGMRFDFIEADSIQDATEKAVFPSGRDEYSALEGDFALEIIFIVPAEYVSMVDVARMKNEIKEIRKREAEKTQKEKELAELKRLQAKYSGTTINSLSTSEHSVGEFYVVHSRDKEF